MLLLPLDSYGVKAILLLTLEKEAEICAPSSLQSGFWPAPWRLLPLASRSSSLTEPPFRPWGCSFPTLFPGRMQAEL